MFLDLLTIKSFLHYKKTHNFFVIPKTAFIETKDRKRQDLKCRDLWRHRAAKDRFYRRIISHIKLLECMRKKKVRN